ncbi:hypothetical protein L2E82_38980 [Cichorium intybus]|uniref:Uncharacterized protein n=1 Tax=Cichorium intybus TaxID=13427 RepID=A0ACB9AGX9_CICIN|nr:hypothetical protein L2E82_38980 [Cichorium intybus]
MVVVYRSRCHVRVEVLNFWKGERRYVLKSHKKKICSYVRWTEIAKVVSGRKGTILVSDKVNTSDWRNGALVKKTFGEALESHWLKWKNQQIFFDVND